MNPLTQREKDLIESMVKQGSSVREIHDALPLKNGKYSRPYTTVRDYARKFKENNGLLKHGLKVLGLWDIHADAVPTDFRIGSWDPILTDSLKSALNFAYDFRPDITIIGGDMINFDEISYFSKGKPGQIEGKKLKNSFDIGNDILDVIDDFTTDHSVYMIGNHEVRLDAYMIENPALEGLLDLQDFLKLEWRDYEVIPENKVHKIGHARFIHGWYYNMYHARKTVDEMGDNIFYGHTHDFQAYTKINAEDKPIIGHSIGCLCNLSPGYRKNRPNRWVNGFGIWYFSVDGTFTFYNPIIIEGKFWWEGKLYTPDMGKEKVNALCRTRTAPEA